MEKKNSNKLKTAAKVVGVGAAAYLANKHGGRVVKAIHDELHPTKWARAKRFAVDNPSLAAYVGGRAGIKVARGIYSAGKVAHLAYKGHKYLPRNTKRIAKVIGLSPAEYKKVWHLHGGVPENSATSNIPGTGGHHVLIGAHQSGKMGLGVASTMAHELSHIKHGHSAHSRQIGIRAIKHTWRAGSGGKPVREKYDKILGRIRLRHEAEASSGLVTGGKGKNKLVSKSLRKAFATYVKNARTHAKTGLDGAAEFVVEKSHKGLSPEYKKLLARYSKFKKAGGLSKEGYKNKSHLRLSSAAEKGNLIEVLSYIRRRKVLECIRSFVSTAKAGNLNEGGFVSRAIKYQLEG